MKYELINSSKNDIERLIKYKKETIYEFANNLSEEEINRINNYIITSVPKLLDNYLDIVINNKVIGCVLITNKDDGKLLDEIYIEEKFRNKGIGTSIIKDIIRENSIVYLWVYKENKQAISLYKKLGFKVIDETDSRYYMKHNNSI